MAADRKVSFLSIFFMSAEIKDTAYGNPPFTDPVGKDASKGLFTPALRIIGANKKLFTWPDENLIDERVKQKGKYHTIANEGAAEPVQGVLDSLPPLFSKYRYSDLAGGILIVPFLNRLQAWFFSGIELVLRTLGEICTSPQYWLNKKIDDYFKYKGDSVTKGLSKILAFIVTSPFWSMGQVFKLAADACSYSRRLVDSGLYLLNLLNPLWWGARWAIGGEAPLRIGEAVKSFAFNLIALLPTAAMIAAIVFTGGLASTVVGPIKAAIIAPIKTAGVALLSALTPAAIAMKAAVVIYLSGAIAGLARIFSGFVRSGFTFVQAVYEKRQGGYKPVGREERRAQEEVLDSLDKEAKKLSNTRVGRRLKKGVDESKHSHLRLPEPNVYRPDSPTSRSGSGSNSPTPSSGEPVSSSETDKEEHSRSFNKRNSV